MTVDSTYGVRRETESGTVISPWLTTAEAARYCGYESNWKPVALGSASRDLGV